MVLIVIAGMPGAGKEELVSVAMSRGYQVVRMGDVVREFASRSSIEVGDKGVGGFANEERQKFGYDVWAKRCLERVMSRPVATIAVTDFASSIKDFADQL